MQKLLLVLPALMLCCCANLFGQDATGRVIGVITDPTGAAIPGVKVTVTNTGTQVNRDTITDQNGYYQVLDLPIGFYSVSAEASGFSKAVADAKQLLINQSLRIDVKLAVGAVSETVKVEGQATNVETVNATLGQSVTTRTIVNLPLNGRNVLDLALLQPGVTENNLSTPTNPRPSTGTFSVAGGRTDSVTYLLDGGLNNNLLSNNVVYNPNPDTVAEFRILTSNYTAEFGRNGAGIVSVVSKSGTNDYHGSLFEYVRNDFFNANLFFNNANGIGTPVLKRNQFGATAGGPITIPKVIRGKDRFFFFMGYQGQRQVQQQQNPSVTTYTPAELKGDFSQSGKGGGPDPRVVSFLQKFPYYQPNAALAAQAIIDPTRINSIAQNYIKANLIPTSGTGVIFPQGGSVFDRDELTEKVDFLITPNDRLSATLGSNRNPQILPFSTESNVPGYPTSNNAHNYFANVAYTKVITPSLLNEVRITAQRQNTLQFSPAVKLPLPADLGIKIVSDDPTGPPQVRLNSGLRIGFSRNGPTTLIDNTYGYADNLTWTRGAHTWKFGFFYSPYQDNTNYDFYINGRFRFFGTSGRASGNDKADVLFGLPDQYTQFPKAPSDIRSHSYSGFAQDEWHVRRNLTLTLGVRYEYNTPKYDTQGRSFSVIPGLQSQRFVSAPPGLLFPGDPGAPKGANFPDKNDLSPRFGFAWSPGNSGKTSIRGGFGVFYDVLKGEDNLQFNGQAPFFGFTSFRLPALGGNPASEPVNFANPFAAAKIVNPFPSRPPAPNINFGAAGFLPFGDAAVYFVDPHLRTPYTYQYNLSVQHEFFNSLIGELNYVGSDSHKLTILKDANPFVPGTNRRLLNGPNNNPAFFSFFDEFTNDANANYNGLQSSLTKRYSDSPVGSVFLTMSFTYGHSIDNGSGFRENSAQVPYYNHKLFRASSDFDVQRRFVLSGGWDLPFDRMWQRGPKRLTRGWSLYPILSSRSGFPFDITSQLVASVDEPGPSGNGDGNLSRANFTGGKIQFRDPREPGNFYFNPSQFSVPTTGYGTLPRNSFRGFGRTNFDLTVSKTTDIFRERLKAEFRADFFNVLNHTQFYEADNNIANGTFGQVSQTWDPRIIQLALRVTF